MALNFRKAYSVNETWKPAHGYEGLYEVSDFGRVRSVRHRDTSRHFLRFIGGKTLKPILNSGYYGVNLYINGKAKLRKIHVLVLEAFIGPRPPGLFACHNDGNALNNHLSNLRWDTPSANIADSVEHRTHVEARKTHCSQGHPFTDGNTRISHDGKRVCKKCHRDRERERYRRNVSVAS